MTREEVLARQNAANALGLVKQLVTCTHGNAREYVGRAHCLDCGAYSVDGATWYLPLLVQALRTTVGAP